MPEVRKTISDLIKEYGFISPKRGITAQYLDTNSELILVTRNLYVVSNRDMAFPNPRRLSPKLKFGCIMVMLIMSSMSKVLMAL